MQIKKVTIEYDEATYVAEGNDARTWKTWMLEAEKVMRKHGWVWNSWTKVDEKKIDLSVSPAGPDEP